MPSLLLALSAVLACQAAGAPAPAQAPAEAPPAPKMSAFVSPLYLGETPPPVRSLSVIHLVHAEVPNAERAVTRSHAETLELATHIVTLLRSGEDFQALAREYSADKNAATGGCLGSFPPGLLTPQLDSFLFAAEVGQVSEPIEAPNGIHIAQRVETYAATRHILVRGTTEAERKKAEALKARIEAGEDFGELARASSDDPFSKERGGLFTIFERGPEDRLLKAAAFDLSVGEVSDPIETSVGYHLIQRVPLEGHPPELRESSMVRLRAILVSHDNTPLGAISNKRTMPEAEKLARELHARIQAGGDMAAIARETNDDLGGKERSGDLGWVHRNNPRSAPFLAGAFAADPGELLDPLLTNVGWVILRRER